MFVIYVEKVPDLKLPLPDEHHIELQAGEKFPPVQSNGREAYWRKA